jgi:hypothetical protein
MEVPGPWYVPRKERPPHRAVSAFIGRSQCHSSAQAGKWSKACTSFGKRGGPMSENKYHVVLEGSLLIDGSEHEARQLLSALFRRHPDDVGQFLDGRARVVANKVTRKKAEEYLALLRRAGIAGRVLRADET